MDLMKKKPYRQRTEIVWRDHCEQESEMPREQVLHPIVQESIGYIVHEEKDFIQICRDWREDNMNGGNLTIIKALILKRTDFDL